MSSRADEGRRPALTLRERIDPAARGRLRVRERAGLQVIEADLPGPFRALFTTRLGGVSDGVFSSLNLDLRSDDPADRVAANRARVGAATSEGAIGTATPRTLVSPAQVHGLRVVGAAEYVAAGPAPDGRFERPCDGLTLHPLLDGGLAALLLFADCVPVIMVGEVDLAVVHAGWRGMVGGVVEQAGRAMTGPPGSAVIGPSLGPCCFAVGEEVAQAFRRRFGAHTVSEGQVDLWAAAATALGELGVREAGIANPRLCTACNRDLFYSYRAEGPITGRHGAVAWTEAAA